jgi:hypothetical protein
MQKLLLNNLKSFQLYECKQQRLFEVNDIVYLPRFKKDRVYNCFTCRQLFKLSYDCQNRFMIFKKHFPVFFGLFFFAPLEVEIK